MSAPDVVIFDESASTSASAAGASRPPATAGKKKKIRQQRWVCDVCKVKWFLDFKEACAHEAQCDGGSPPSSSQSSSQSSSASVAKEIAVEASLISADSNDGVGAAAKKKRKDAPGSSSSSVSSASKPSQEKVAAVIAAAKARVAKGKNADTSLDTKPKPAAEEALKAAEIVDSDDEDMVVSKISTRKSGEGGSLKRPAEDNGRRSKRLRDAPAKPPPLKDNNTPSDASKEAKDKAAKPAKASKPGKASSKSDKSSNVKKSSSKTSKPSKSDKAPSKKKGATKGGGGQIASIFLPKKGLKADAAALSKKDNKASSKKASNNEEVLPGVSKEDYEEHLAAERQAAQRTKKRAVEADDKRKVKKKQQTLRKREKPAEKDVVDIEGSSEESSDEDVEYVEKPTTKSGSGKNFLSKKVIAEHQAADFFAKRKQKAAEERERQRKREEARAAKLNGKSGAFFGGGKSGKAIDTDVSSVMSSSGETLKAASEGKRTVAALRFPCPSHVLSLEDSSLDSKGASSSALQMLRETPRHSSLKPETASSTSDADDVVPSLSFLRDADQTDRVGIRSTVDLLSSVFDHRNDDHSVCEDNLLWADKHSMSHIPDDILGEGNKKAAESLTSFVEEWKVRRHKAVEVMGQVKRKKKRRRKRSGYDSDDSFIDSGPGGLESLFLITGPTGSGKTSLVHAVAEQMDCAVIEINSSGARSGAALKRAIQETTQSHSSLAISKKKQNKGANNFFGKKNQDEADDSEESEESDGLSDSESDEESVRESHSLTIILIDEVDLLFDEDTAFWPALAQMSQKSKCPIVLTATSAPGEVSNYRYQEAALQRPAPQECAIKMAEVSKTEGMTFNDGIDLEEKLRRLSLIAEVCQCDMRKILNEMQMFHLAGSQRSRSVGMGALWLEAKVDYPSSTFPEDSPLVLSVEPKVVPKDRHTLVTITGKNFSSMSYPSEHPAESVSVFIGGKHCSHYRIISDSQIIAVCPPCVVPDVVSESLIYEESKELDCLTCKFVEIAIIKRCSNGLVLDSNGGAKATRLNIEYDIPLRDRVWEDKTSKADFKRAAKARKEARAKEMAGDSDGLMSSDEDEFEAKQQAPADSQNEDDAADDNDDNEEAMNDDQPEKKDEIMDIDPQTLLDEAIASISCQAPTFNGEAALVPDGNQTTLPEFDTFADELGRLSDAVLLEDSFTALAVPSLSGAVEGFGSNAIDSSFMADPTIDKLCKGKNKKPPSIDTIYSTGVNESGFFFGNSDSYVSTLSRRDRQLLSSSHLHSRGHGFLDTTRLSEESTENSKSGLGEEDEESLFDQPKARLCSEDDILLNPQMSPALQLLPSLLEQGLSCARANGFTRDQTPLVQLRRDKIAMDALGVMHNTVAQCDRWYVGLRHDEESVEKSLARGRDSVLDRTLSLDYLPYLRAIAHHENQAHKRVEEMLKENGDAAGGGRQTRRSKRSNIRRHYLDASSGRDDSGAIEGAYIGLAERYLVDAIH